MPTTAPSGIMRVRVTGRYMPMPTASGGKEKLVVLRRISSTRITPTPISAPSPISDQSRELPKIPEATEDSNAACGAARASSPAPGAPTKPKLVIISCSTGGMIAEPNSTPMISATCCFHGVAPTIWPVLRSCRLSFEMVAIPNTTAAVNSVNATSASGLDWDSVPVMALMSRAAESTTMMPTPEIGEFEAPIRPAM